MQKKPEHSEHYLTRKAALKKKGVSHKSIADELRIARPNVTLNIQGKARARNQRVERAVASALGWSLRKTYPEWYK